MRLWLKVRRTRACLIAVAILATLLIVLGDLVVSLPALGSLHGWAMPVALLTPLIVILVLGWGLASGEWRLEAVSSRQIPRHDTAFVIAFALLVAVVGGVIEVLGLSRYGYAAARNAIGCAGLLLVGRRIGGGTVGPLAPALFVLVVAAFGGDFEGQPRWWAWLVADGLDPRSWLLALMSAVVGIAVSFNARYPLFGHY